MSPERWALTAGLLGALVLALYGQVLGYPFVYDDVSLIGTNAALSDLSTLWVALTHDLFHFADGVRPSPYWRPLVTLSYYVDQALGGGAPAAFHGTNLLALGAAALGLFGLLSRAGLGWGPAVLLAALFLVHPLQVEGAANVAGRTDLFCAACGLWALQVRRPWLAAVLVLLACGAKEIAVVLPLVAWLLDRDDPRWRGQAMAVGVFLALRAAALSGVAVAAADVAGPTTASLAGTGSRVLFWLGRLLWPTPMGPAADLMAATGLAAAAGWLAVSVLALAAWRQGRGVRAASALVLLPLLLVSGLVQAAPRYGDTLTILPWAGVVWLVGLLFVRTSQAVLVAPALAAVVLAGLSHERLPDWASSEGLWEAAHARAPDDRVVTLNLARSLVESRPRTALAVSDPALWPKGSRQRREAATVAARAHLNLGEEDAALDWLSQAVADDPEADWANGTACVLLAARGSRAAGEVCNLAVASLPNDADVQNAMGIAVIRTGGPAGALPWFIRAAELAPDRPEFAANRDRAAQALSGP